MYFMLSHLLDHHELSSRSCLGSSLAAVGRRPVLGKTAYKVRVRRLCQTKAAQKAAGHMASSLRSVCQIFIENGGHASGK